MISNASASTIRSEKKLKSWIAFLNVSSDDPAVREKAIYSMLDKLDSDMMESFQALLETEKNKNVLKAIHVALALGHAPVRQPGGNPGCLTGTERTALPGC